jgi:hypothetical protein
LFISYNGSLRRIRKANGEYFITMTARMLIFSPPNLSGTIERAVSKDGEGSRGQTEVVGRFSVERKTFLPYGIGPP